MNQDRAGSDLHSWKFKQSGPGSEVRLAGQQDDETPVIPALCNFMKLNETLRLMSEIIVTSVSEDVHV